MYEIFSNLLQKHGVTPYKVSKETGVSQSTLSDWKRGLSTPKIDKLQKIADYFEVSVEYLMTGKDSTYELPKGAIPVDISSFVKIPIIGTVRCGEPMFADSNIEGYQLTPITDIRDGETFFYLKAKGDSMINAGISDGDLLLVRKQSDVDSGEIAIVNVNGDEETLKRVIKKDNAIILQPENPAYDTKIYMGKELEDVHIQGRLMQVVKRF